MSGTFTASGTYTGGFYVSGYTTLSLTATGYVEGPGIVAPNPCTVVNRGRVNGTTQFDTGIYLRYGTGGSETCGTVINGANSDITPVIKGGVGMRLEQNGTVFNYGSIIGTGGGSDSGVYLVSGGNVRNGSLADTKALIEGQYAVRAFYGNITNFAVIDGLGVTAGDAGVLLNSSGEITNGALTDRGALIEGYTGVRTGQNNVTNLATIKGLGGVSQAGVDLGGATLTNGTPVDTSALIEAYSAVTVSGGGAVDNFGVINGTGPITGVYGVLFTNGGELTNGVADSQAAFIEGYAGVKVEAAAGTVTNFGSIRALGLTDQAGVDLVDGGVVNNGAVDDANASIKGVDGVVFGGVGSLANYGLVESSIHDAVLLSAGGSVVNGAPTDTAAQVGGLYGVVVQALGTVTNFGVIASSSGAGAAVELASGKVFNGGGGDQTALIKGASGVDLNGSGEVVNYATITGVDGAGWWPSGPRSSTPAVRTRRP